MEEVIEHFKNLYPDEMVLTYIEDFERLKLAGKVELIREMVSFMEEEYSVKFNKHD